MSKVEIVTDEAMKEDYDVMLDETKEHWIDKYYGARVLKEVDEIAYNKGYFDFVDFEAGKGRVLESEEGNYFWKCPECGEAYDDEEEAKECCNDG
jgi:hypothetical protein